MNRKKIFNKRQRILLGTIVFFVVLILGPRNSSAIMYSPGQTLNPACLPTDVTCGVISYSIATSSDVFKYASSTIAAWGDSLTAGTGGSGTTYPDVLQSVIGVAVYNGGVGGETSTQIRTRMIAATDKYNWPAIIWAGRNNYTSAATVKADIAAMVAALGTDNYLILGITNNSTETSATNSYSQIITLNSDLASIYGSHFIDIRTYLVSQYNSGLSQDVTDHSNDVIPNSLRSDTTHLNAAGYTVVANYIKNNYLTTLVPASSHKLVTTDVLYSLKNHILASPLISGNLSLDSATSPLYGAVYKGGSRFIHDYYNPANDGKNTFVGVNAGNFTLGSVSGSSYYGSYDTGMGYNALSSLTTGYYNVAVGSYAMQNTTTGKDNAAVGNGAMQTNNTGFSNTAMGRSALSSNTSGYQNSAFGYYSLQTSTTGTNNTGFGYRTLKYLTTGTGLTAVGYNAGVGQTDVSNYNSTVDTYSTFIGYGASRASTISSTTVLTNVTAIGYNATVGASNSLVLGGTGAYAVNVGIGTTTPGAQLETTGTVRFANFGAGTLTTDATGNLSVSSDENLKDVKGKFVTGLSAIELLDPINFNWKPESGLDTTHMYTGFSAQNVQKVIPEAVGEDKNGHLTLSDRPILAAVVNAEKELSKKINHIKVGTAQVPDGITIYDSATHDPYCFKIIYGQLSVTKGECVVDTVTVETNIKQPTTNLVSTTTTTTTTTTTESATTTNVENSNNSDNNKDNSGDISTSTEVMVNVQDNKTTIENVPNTTESSVDTNNNAQ